MSKQKEDKHFFGHWWQLYLLVIGFLVLQILIYYWVSLKYAV